MAANSVPACMPRPVPRLPEGFIDLNGLAVLSASPHGLNGEAGQPFPALRVVAGAGARGKRHLDFWQIAALDDEDLHAVFELGRFDFRDLEPAIGAECGRLGAIERCDFGTLGGLRVETDGRHGSEWRASGKRRA